MKIADFRKGPYDGKEVKLRGWVKSIRRQGKSLVFIHLFDGSCFEYAQLVFHKSRVDLSLLATCREDTALMVTGNLVESPKEGQPYEVQVMSIDYISKEPDDYGESYILATKDVSVAKLRKIPHLRCRTRDQCAIITLRDCCARATHDFFGQRHFKYIHTPIFTRSDCEGAGEMFAIKDGFFKRPTFLTVSGQLEVEGFASAVGDSYTFGPTFRAEHSDTNRHLAEFWMIEPEMVGTFDEVVDTAEKYIQYSILECIDKCGPEMEFLGVDAETLGHMVSTPFARVKYEEAIKHLDIPWGADLSSEQEMQIVAELGDGLPTIVTHYPKEIKSFYMRRDRKDDRVVECMDILVPGIGELVGGSEREEEEFRLLEAMTEKGIDHKPYEWYLELRRFGSMPHGGFGLGFERLVRLVSGCDHIRDVIPYPQYYGQ